jgi:hypothetical protein
MGRTSCTDGNAHLHLSSPHEPRKLSIDPPHFPVFLCCVGFWSLSFLFGICEHFLVAALSVQSCLFFDVPHGALFQKFLLFNLDATLVV